MYRCIYIIALQPFAHFWADRALKSMLSHSKLRYLTLFALNFHIYRIFSNKTDNRERITGNNVVRLFSHNFENFNALLIPSSAFVRPVSTNTTGH